jgi:phenylalanyl-tRNA synthetase beta chain
VAFYELSKVFEKRSPGEQPNEPLHLGIILMRPEEAYRYLKGIVDALGGELGVELGFAPAKPSAAEAPGRVAIISAGRHELGRIGQLNPALLQWQKLSGETAFLELDVDRLLPLVRPQVFTPLERFPGIQRDVAVVVPTQANWQDVAAALAEVPRTRVQFVSDYYGDELPAGHKSLALRLVIHYPDRTPTDAEAADVERKVAAILARKFEATVRD